MPKKTSTEPPLAWKQFILFWWTEGPGNRMAVYRTRQPGDIEVFGRNHYRMHFRPDSVEDDEYEMIIRHHKGEWLIKIEDEEEFSYFYDQDDATSVWTWADETNRELFVIRGDLRISN
jgi:hypothetical protein